MMRCMKRIALCAALALAGFASAEPEPFDLDRAVAQWVALCEVVAPAGSPENNSCVLQRYDTERLAAAQRQMAEDAAMSRRLDSYNFIMRGF